MKCKLEDRERKLDDYVLGRLSSEESEALEIHAFSCPDCLEELRMREQMIGVMREKKADHGAKGKSQTAAGVRKGAPAPHPIRRGHHWIYYAMAGAVLLVTVLFLNRPLDQSSPDSDRFVESAYLESVLTQTFQSGDISVADVSPSLGADISGDILFQWKAQKGGEDFVGELALKILDNKENVVHSATVWGSQYAFENVLQPGLYYWTLEGQGQMIYLGKFVLGRDN
ncbi:zf-HC2 domain-containing protein [bacterium]|nr:zf-HC2 domain-containing protein [bacterium]